MTSTQITSSVGTNITTEAWDIINSYFAENPNWMARHQLDSYNDFVSHKMPLIFKNVNKTTAFMFDKLDGDITYQVDVFLGGKEANRFKIAPPTIYDSKTGLMRPMYPNEARLKNLTYGFDVFVDMELEYKSKKGDEVLFEGAKLPETEFLKNIYLGKIPIMVHSNMCSLNKIPREALPEFGESQYEPGGYFIIDGREKVFLSQERKVENTIILAELNDNKYVYSAEVKSVNDEAFENARSNKLLVENSGSITFIVGMEDKPFIQPVEGRHTPLFILFRLLGIESDIDIMKMIVGDVKSELGAKLCELLRPCAHDPFITKFHVYDRQSAEKYMEPLTSRSKTNISTQQDQLTEINKNKISRLSWLYDTIRENVLPHTGPEFLNKAYYLAHMTRRLLLRSLDMEKNTDRDSFLNKRVDTCGHLMASLFKECIRQGFMYNARREIETNYELNGNTFLGKNIINLVHQDNYYKVFNFKVFMDGSPPTIPGFMSSLKRGQIGQKAGVIQALDRINYYAYISHIRRLNDPVLGGRVQDKQRYLHNTHYGYLCPAETPEGQSVGLRKALALLTTITIGYPTNQLQEFCLKNGVIALKYLKPMDTHTMTKVFINGNWIGCCMAPAPMVEKFRLMRRNGLINHTTSISWYTEKGEVYICSDTGRLVRPMLIIGPGNELLIQPADIKDVLVGKKQFSDLCTTRLARKDGGKRYFTNLEILNPEVLDISSRDPELLDKLRASQAVMEYIDLNEMDTLLLAKDLDYNQTSKNHYTHVDLHPAVIMGAMVQTSPCIHHGQGGKYFGHSKHIKQSVSQYTDNFMHRIDTSAHLLHNPEKPIIQTRMTGVMNHDQIGTGNNIIVAIAYYNGYNQEDGIIGNQTALDLGLYDSSYYKMYEEVEKQDEKAGMEEHFFNPKFIESNEDFAMGDSGVPETLALKPDDKRHEHLDRYGFAKEGSYLEKNDILIGKYLKTKTQDGRTEYVSMSHPVKDDNADSYVDKVFTCTTNAAGNRLCKIRTCQHRKPQHGDKFASRNGQKGTFGLLMPREDLPFTTDGVVPDIIIHPSAYPKRMTVNQLIELLYGTLAVECGFYGVAGGLDTFDTETINEVLCDKLGLSYYGDRVLYNGIYGEQMDVAIFMGPIFYQRLKLQVQDKINARPSGVRQDGVPVPGASYTVRERAVVSGRANGGGIKIGEMERDALIAHGVSGFINERDMVRGDKFYVFVSTVNGEIAIANHEKNIYFDSVADGPLSYHLEDGTGQGKRSIMGINTLRKRQTGFVRVAIPYAMKLLIHEINGLGMRLRLQPRIVKLLIDREASGHMDELLLQMEDLIHEDEEQVAELLTKSITEQIEKQVDLEDKILESYQNAETKKPFFEYKADQQQQMEHDIESEMAPVGQDPIFKHRDELPHPSDVMPIITDPMLSPQTVINTTPYQPTVSLAPVVTLDQTGGTQLSAPVQQKTVSFALPGDAQMQTAGAQIPTPNTSGTFISTLGPVELELPGSQLEGGASEDEFGDADFGVAPLANTAPQLQTSAISVTPMQTGGVVQPPAPNPELKVINISGNDKDLAELAMMK
jgi:DNA-directed RNA polymerase II subunit RPB2